MSFYLQFHCWFFWTTFVTSFTFYCSISFIVVSIINSNYNIISNNVNGIKTLEKGLKSFEYLRNNINNNGFIFLQETHSSSNIYFFFFFFFSKAILVMWQSAIVEQKLFSDKHIMWKKWTNSNSWCRIEWHKYFTNQYLQF